MRTCSHALLETEEIRRHRGRSLRERGRDRRADRAAQGGRRRLAPSSHPVCRPNPLEAEAVARLLRIAEVADVPIVIVHLSTKEALLRGHARARAADRRSMSKPARTTCCWTTASIIRRTIPPLPAISARRPCARRRIRRFCGRPLPTAASRPSRPTIAALR